MIEILLNGGHKLQIDDETPPFKQRQNNLDATLTLKGLKGDDTFSALLPATVLAIDSSGSQYSLYVSTHLLRPENYSVYGPAGLAEDITYCISQLVERKKWYKTKRPFLLQPVHGDTREIYVTVRFELEKAKTLLAETANKVLGRPKIISESDGTFLVCLPPNINSAAFAKILEKRL